MTRSYVEREWKFDVEPGFAIPEVSDLLPPGGRIETCAAQLRSDYHDTLDHALLRARITLRRRTGSTDTGWQLKVPAEAFREEIRVDDPTGDTVPADLQRLLTGVTAGRPLIRLASLTTERSITRLLDAGGRLLAEIDDDSVHASAAGPAATASSWREVEVELGEAELDLLYALGKRLRRAGARTSASGSKLARALAAPTTNKPSKPTAGEVTGDYLAEQQRMVLLGDLALRRGDASVIHPTRVATRRLRSTLRVFHPLFDPERATALDTELRWLAGLLGEVRDRQVLRKRLDGLLAELEDGLLLGPVRARLTTELHASQAAHWDALQQALTGQRYLNLLAELDSWLQRPPHTATAGQPAAALGKLVGRAERKVSRRLARANSAGDMHLLHGARKAAKRARYAAEAATPVLGRKAASKQAKKYQRLQDLLGEHQDSLLSAELLRQLGAKAGTVDGENGFAFGVLHEREQRNARKARRRARRVAKRYS